MKCGIYTWFGYVLPFEEKLKLIRNAGFDTVCTWWDDLFAEIDGVKEEHFALAARAGLFLEHTHLPYFGCDALWFDGGDSDDLQKKYATGVAGAGKSGIGTVVMHPFERTVPAGGSLAVFMERMRRIGDCAAQNGVRLAVENLTDAAGLKRVLEELWENPFVGLCFDTGHNHVECPNDFSLLQRFSGRVFALHVHDNHGVEDEHILPYDGTVNWRAFLPALEDTGFSGSLMLETCFPVDMRAMDKDPLHVYTAPDVPPEAYLADAKRRCGIVLGQGKEEAYGSGTQNQP